MAALATHLSCAETATLPDDRIRIPAGKQLVSASARDAIALVLDERSEHGEAIPATGWALVESVEIPV